MSMRGNKRATGLRGESSQPGTSKASQPSTSKASQPSTSKASQPSTSKASQPSTSKASQPSTSKASQPSTSKACQPTTSKDCQPSTSKECQPSTSKACQPSTSKACQPSTSKDCQPSTSKACQPSTSKACQPSTSKASQPGTSRQSQPGTSRQSQPSTSKQSQPGTSRQSQPSTSKQCQPSTSKQCQPSTSKCEPGPSGTSKRRRAEPDDWQLRPDVKMSSIYNRSASEAPAELFRKDLISAMKLPDSEPLTPSEYWIITDTWKQDWERGVQVPVNPDSLPAPVVRIIDNPRPPDFKPFKLPKDKYIHLTRDAYYQPDKHCLSTTPAKAEAACAYDLDAADTAWLELLNLERARAGLFPINEDQLEKVIEELEVRTWDKIQAIMKSEEGLGIEYDENVICDVCRSPDSEDGNEMVFCDSCNICVHQACYGITVIPDGQWLCRPCGDGVRPTCVLCPNLGGAMKCTPSGHKWAHVSCVLWIPEVSIGCAEKMEPITKISSIPASRWSLVCVLCRERKGACIQCSVKTCKTAYHVTCAFKHGLEMRAIIEDENADDGVKLRSYCQKHSVNSKKDKCSGSGSEEEEVKRKRRKDMTSEEKTQARAARLQEIEREFDRHVSLKDISSHLLDVDQDAIHYIYNYWKLKRRAGHNRPLLPPKTDDSELMTHRQEQADLDKMKMFVQLRQDLERVRNLCYMVSRREKLSRSFFRMREQTFHKQVGVLSGGAELGGPEFDAVVQANHGPSIYDQLYSHPGAPNHKNNFEELLARIAPPEMGDDKKKDRNGLVKGSKTANPYKKHYVNGSRRSGSMCSGLSSEESAPEMTRSGRYRGRAISSTDEDVKKPISPKKKVSPKTKAKRSPKKPERKKKKVPQSKALVESSSEDEVISARTKKDRSRSKTLQQMEKEMAAGTLGQSATDSDEFMPIRSTRNSKFPVDIYSDSSEEATPTKADLKTKVKTEKVKVEKIKAEKSPSANDSQQPLPRTKGAMKEFIPEPEKKPVIKEEDKPAPKKRGRKPSNKNIADKDKQIDKKPPVKVTETIGDEPKPKEKAGKQKDNPTDLIVPQRQAAKKASENMRSTTAVKKEEPQQSSPEDPKLKPKVKSKGKEVKETASTSTATPAKVGRKKSSKDVDKETIAYVPQRQAAKKAAAHIKSGLGSKLPVVEANDNDKKKDGEKADIIQTSPKKLEDGKKPPSKESSSSSSSSSSSCSSSSSSSDDDDEEEEEEHEKPGMKPTAKAREIKPAVVRQPSMFSPPGSRPTVDLPFLDKVSRPLSSTSASSDGDSSKESRGSGSDSPSPKRPRRRRKGKSLSTDTSPRKAPDKKLKTSERGSECRVPSPIVEGEESSRPNARAATRARTRSTTASGNMPNKSDAGSRKSSKDDTGLAAGANKTSKESGQSRELPPAEWQANKEVKNEIKEEVVTPEFSDIDTKPKIHKTRRQSMYHDDKDKIEIVETAPRISPRKSAELKQKAVTTRRMSVKETAPEVSKPKQRRQSRNEVLPTQPCKKKIEPLKKALLLQKPRKMQTSPIPIHDDYSDNDKHWLPKAPSPNVDPPPVEKAGGPDKYMTEDKSMDSDYADKSSSIKMIAKIQANLNENTMIKSPKTPMDARTVTLDHIDVDNPISRNIRKQSILDAEKKFITQDASHVGQGVEISKSAKIPSAVNQFTNRSLFSPQHKENELFELDMLAVDDGFNHEDIMKPFTAYPEFFFKEDSKEQGVQETLNLVDRLRMQLSTKKVPTEKDEPILIGDEKEEREDENTVASNTSEPEVKEVPIEFVEKRSPPKDNHIPMNHLPQTYAPSELPLPPNESMMDSKDYLQPIPMTSNDKWPIINTMVRSDVQDRIDLTNERKYDTSQYVDDVKEPLPSDVQSLSEVGDTISISKQSDDSQPLSVVDHSITSNDQDLTQDNHNYENNNSMIHSDCATISSPYVSQDSKWRESKITTRRSSASSTNSEGSVCSQKTDSKSHLNSCDSHQGNVMPEIDSYPPLPAYSCAVEPALPLNQYSTYPTDATAYLNSLPFAQLPLPSPGPGLYGAGLPFTPTGLLPPKPFPLCAAFTTSSQNIALTTQMIAPPTPKPTDSPRDDLDVPRDDGSDKYIHVVSSPSISIDSFNDSSNTRPATKMSNDSNETMSSIIPIQDVKSPPKVVKTTPKFPGKSPGKSSPGISPRQGDGPKGTKRAGSRNNRSQRGRGRSKSRGQGVHGFPPMVYMGNSIQNKLVGTVYDFNEELANDGVDLKALRERRKSIDIRDDRKSEHSYKDTSPSPRVSPLQASKHTPTIETKDVKPPSPLPSEHTSSSGKVPSDRGPGFSSVQPVLPGPVDMRTYQPFENAVPPASETYHSHLLEFASGTAGQQLVEIDEEVEKQLHTALMASKPQPGSVTPAPIPEPKEPPKETFVPQLPKVSLSDSRNQLKVKIKGPFLDANYSASSVQPVVPQPPAPVHETTTTMFNAATASSGSGNLRRMRKKELLRQYWTQDMNMDDPAHAAMMGAAPAPAAPPPLARAVITIPKAVASMTSIPTREDYKFSDAPVEKKKRKTTSGLSRELRHLEVSMNDVDASDDVKLSNFSSNTNQNYKRRGRVTAKPNKSNPTSPPVAKLKIKIGSNIVQQVNEEPSSFQFRPPKKRLTSIPKPSLEDLRRESMKYRRMVIAEFEETEKVKKHKPNKSEKRKKKKDKKAEKLLVVNSESESATKLIIKIKRPKEEEGAENGAAAAAGPSGAAAAAAAAPEPPVDPFEYDPSAPDPLAIDPPSYSESSAMRKIRTAKVTPIRLKLARSSAGSGYVMSQPGEPGAPEGSPPAAALPLAVNKHCEVR
ncbi:PHD finger protein rhinoceros [Ostrinia furnacalis]|uniref:PHD finger protein rhinoceros n=1 Tax=Ostrinia furnacalis TaxID=93504 RepID=UPI00103E9427|nr:PHD finger protein rhinoceros [Ostrinia furnacalis]XP_028166717.1 PHD finger protein rhinoceros [Ostrinia furnacalis]XP_028166718.1 PHD finger protein rhinoceros [Ostrinia furnacalis]XP_028166719.1 PHD finger protein rhinoceros [Ostrinia furnacalis]